MNDLLDWLFGTEGFPPRWSCGRAWEQEPGLGWAHIISDLVTWASYAAIPAVLMFFVLRRRDMAFPRVFWLFSAFVFCCGSVHLVEAVIFWEPVYRISALLKVMTAVVSAATVIALIKVLPKALRLPGLAAVNDRLEQEVAQRKQAEQELAHYSRELERSNTDLAQFAYSASHDLKAPLRTIQQLAEWLQEDEVDRLSGEGKDLLDKIGRRSERMQRLLQDLLEYSRPRSEDPAPIHLGELMEEIAGILGLPETFQLTWTGADHTIRTTLTPLRLVLLNLVGNAWKHHDGKAGHIRVDFRVTDDMVRFEVHDDGPGIPEEFRERIFTVFETLQPKDEVDGSGLGLAMVSKFVRRRGGTIDLRSGSGGRGSIFAVSWPLRSGHPKENQ